MSAAKRCIGTTDPAAGRATPGRHSPTLGGADRAGPPDPPGGIPARSLAYGSLSPNEFPC